MEMRKYQKCIDDAVICAKYSHPKKMKMRPNNALEYLTLYPTNNAMEINKIRPIHAPEPKSNSVKISDTSLIVLTP